MNNYCVSGNEYNYSHKHQKCRFVFLISMQGGCVLFLYSEPTLTLPNLLSVLEGVTNWYDLGLWLGVPRSKRDDIRCRYLTDSEGLKAVLKEWLENHPAPSWRGLARALYRRRGVAELTALQRVYHKYLPGMSAVQ